MNVSIRSPNNIFIRWIFVFGIVFSGFFVNSFNVFANESESLVVGPHNAESINSFLKTVDKTKTNYIVKRYLVLCQYLGHKKSNFFMLYF